MLWGGPDNVPNGTTTATCGLAEDKVTSDPELKIKESKGQGDSTLTPQSRGIHLKLTLLGLIPKAIEHHTIHSERSTSSR